MKIVKLHNIRGVSMERRTLLIAIPLKVLSVEKCKNFSFIYLRNNIHIDYEEKEISYYYLAYE
jgi:hypothetical protein